MPNSQIPRYHGHPGEGPVKPKGFPGFARFWGSDGAGTGHPHQALLLKFLSDLPGGDAEEVLTRRLTGAEPHGRGDSDEELRHD